MWSDILQHAERLHLLRISLWGALCTVAGTSLLVMSFSRIGASKLLRRFAAICAVLGGLETLIGAASYRSVPLRDLSGAARLERTAWLQLGLYLGLVGVGMTLLLTGYQFWRRDGISRGDSLAAMGAGAAIVLHGLGLATLELLLIADISR